jgi:anti-sigma B factor antagonist
VSILSNSSDGQILTIEFTEARILDELLIRQMQEDVIKLLGEAKERFVLLDFHRVQFLSSAALGALLRVHKKCKDFQVSLRMSNIAADIAKVFKITNLNSIFQIHKDAEEAIQAFQKEPRFFE